MVAAAKKQKGKGDSAPSPSHLWQFEGQDLYTQDALVEAVNARLGGQIVSLSSLRRAMRQGTRCRDGSTVTIPSLRIGKARFSSLEAVLETIAEIQRRDGAA